MVHRIHEAIRNRVAEEGYALHEGMELLEVGAGRAVVSMVPGSDHLNMFGMVHGGAIYGLMDEAFQVSCNTHGTVALALNVNVVYHNAPQPGVRLVATANEVHRTSKTGTYEIRVTDEGGRLIASCQALAYRKRETLPFMAPASESA